MLVELGNVRGQRAIVREGMAELRSWLMCMLTVGPWQHKSNTSNDASPFHHDLSETLAELHQNTRDSLRVCVLRLGFINATEGFHYPTDET